MQKYAFILDPSTTLVNMAFLSRLDDAKSSLERERLDISPKKSKNSDSDSKSTHLSHSPVARQDSRDEAKEGHNEEKNSKMEYKMDYFGEPEDRTDLVSQCAEYIFDLFDANMLEDYHVMETFENKALAAFVDYENTEISFEQERLHNQFLDLFEEMISKFLKEKKCSTSEFYNQVNAYLNDESDTKLAKDSAREVVETIFAYTDLQLWHTNMREMSRYRAKVKKKYPQMASSSSSSSSSCPTCTASVDKFQTKLEQLRAKAQYNAIQRAPASKHRLDR